MEDQINKRNLKIVKVIPVEWYELIIELSNGEKLLFPKNDEIYKEHKFLSYPDKLMSFKFGPTHIKWKNEFWWGDKLKFDLKGLIQNSEQVDLIKLKNKSLRICRKNQAPTQEDERHHVYQVAIRPYDFDNLIVISESIGGGLGDRGGGYSTSIENMIKNPNWKNHFKLSNCKWAIELIEKYGNNPAKLVEKMIDQILKK